MLDPYGVVSAGVAKGAYGKRPPKVTGEVSPPRSPALFSTRRAPELKITVVGNMKAIGRAAQLQEPRVEEQ